MVKFNPTRWLSRTCWSALMAAGVLLTGARASAETCGDDDSCPKGYMCQSYGMTACVQKDCPPEDLECAKWQAEQPECQPTEIKECVPAPCQSDSDCADGMVCYVQEFTQCSGGTAPACAPVAADGGVGDCPMIEPAPLPECTTVKHASCVPRYVPPCLHDADCGPGFTCKEEIATTCSSYAGKEGGTGGKGAFAAPLPAVDAGVGDGGTDDGAPADAGTAYPNELPPPPTCTSEPTGRFYCELQRIECGDDSECPADFTCAPEGQSVVCDGAGPTPSGEPRAYDAGTPAYPTPEQDGGSSSSDSAGSGGSGGAADAPLPPSDAADAGTWEMKPIDSTCKIVELQRVCLPPYPYYSRGAAGAPVPSQDSGEHLSPTSGTKGDAGVAAGEAPPTDSDDAAQEHPVLKCSAGTLGGRDSALGLLALAGVATYLRRRRSSN